MPDGGLSRLKIDMGEIIKESAKTIGGCLGAVLALVATLGLVRPTWLQMPAFFLLLAALGYVGSFLGGKVGDKASNWVKKIEDRIDRRINEAEDRARDFLRQLLIWIRGLFNPSLGIRLQSERLTEMAIKNDIAKKAKIVIGVLGRDYLFSDGIISIRIENFSDTARLTISHFRDFQWVAVFKCETRKGYIQHTESDRLLINLDDRRQLIVRDHLTAKIPDSFEINSYVTGPWEKHLGQLTRKSESELARGKQLQDESERAKKDKQEREESDDLKRRFGL